MQAVLTHPLTRLKVCDSSSNLLHNTGNVATKDPWAVLDPKIVCYRLPIDGVQANGNIANEDLIGSLQSRSRPIVVQFERALPALMTAPH